MNESLIGSRHEETVGINTGWGLKVTMERKLQNKTETITARFHSLYRCLQDAGAQKRVGLDYPTGHQTWTEIELRGQVW